MFAAKLRELREAKGWSQKQLAGAAGIGFGAVRDYEQGRRSPSWENVVALCRALGASCELFMPPTDDGSPATPEPEKRGRGRPKKAAGDDAPAVPPAKASKPGGRRKKDAGKKG